MELDGLIIVAISYENYPESFMLGAGIVTGFILGLVIRLLLNEYSLNISQAFAAMLIVIVIASTIGLVAQRSQPGNKTMGPITYASGLLFMFGITLLGTTDSF